MLLNEARKAAGLSTRGLAEKLKSAGHAVSHVSISKYERDEFSPTPDTLKAIADILGRTPEWFESSTPLLAGVRFRAIKTLSQTTKDQFAAGAAPWLRLYIHVSQLLESLPQTGHQIQTNPSESSQDLAKQVRQVYTLEEYPVPSVVQLLEDAGALVIGHDGPAGIDAFTAHFGSYRVVVVNRSLPPDRMRLTLSHELGHILRNDCDHDRVDDVSDGEGHAFEFASHFLMPSTVLAKAFEGRSMVQLVKYKEQYGISLAAMIYRATQEGLIPRSMAQRLWREFSRLGWRRHEPGNVAADYPVRMESLVDSALRQKRATLNELAIASALTPGIIKDRVNDAMGATNPHQQAPHLRIAEHLDDEDAMEETHE